MRFGGMVEPRGNDVPTPKTANFRRFLPLPRADCVTDLRGSTTTFIVNGRRKPSAPSKLIDDGMKSQRIAGLQPNHRTIGGTHDALVFAR